MNIFITHTTSFFSHMFFANIATVLFFLLSYKFTMMCRYFYGLHVAHVRRQRIGNCVRQVGTFFSASYLVGCLGALINYLTRSPIKKNNHFTFQPSRQVKPCYNRQFRQHTLIRPYDQLRPVQPKLNAKLYNPLRIVPDKVELHNHVVDCPQPCPSPCPPCSTKKTPVKQNTNNDVLNTLTEGFMTGLMNGIIKNVDVGEIFSGTNKKTPENKPQNNSTNIPVTHVTHVTHVSPVPNESSSDSDSSITDLPEDDSLKSTDFETFLRRDKTKIE